MRRRHLFEFEDLSWFPPFLRNATTEWLQQQVVLKADPYRHAAPLIAKLLERQGTETVLDLCSGAGGPWQRLKAGLEKAYGGPVSLVLTDKFPNRLGFERTVNVINDGRTSYQATPVDATAVGDESPKGVRTLFTSIHHQRPARAKSILEDAFERRAAIGVFDFVSRDGLIVSLPRMALWIFASMRKTFPRSPAHLLLSYAIPVIPLTTLWDAFVSGLRAYTPEDFQAMTADLTAEDWEWETGTAGPPGEYPITYVIGFPTYRD